MNKMRKVLFSFIYKGPTPCANQTNIAWFGLVLRPFEYLIIKTNKTNHFDLNWSSSTSLMPTSNVDMYICKKCRLRKRGS